VSRGREAPDGPTFKWSRDNGTVAWAVDAITWPRVRLREDRQDLTDQLRPGDWVELVDADYVLENRAEPLQEVVEVDPVAREVTLQSDSGVDSGQGEG
jgi:hypothetical protein